MTLRVVADDAIPYLEGALPGAVIEARPGREIRTEDLRHAHALLVRSVTQVDRALVSGSSLRLVASATAGVDHIDARALRRARIGFASAPGCNALAVVQYVLAAIFACDAARGPIGVVGYGHIGRPLTRALTELGLPVIVCDPFVGRPEFVGMRELLARARVVTLHVPLTRSGPHPTHHLIGAGEFDQMPLGAVLINTSRGPVVDNDALVRWGGRAVLDVWEDEPQIRHHVLRAVEIATPHIAGYSVEGKVNATAAVLEAIADQFGVENRFDATRLLGAAIPLRAASIREALLATCPLLQYDAQLRSGSFEALRKALPLRRELKHYVCYQR